METIRPKPAPWTFREDLELFGIRLPEKMPWDDLASTYADNPARNTLALVAVASVLFLKAEKGHNPKVNDIFDAMVYCSTCLNVGYGDIFAKTSLGKVIGTVLMTLGPSAAARFMDGSRKPAEAPAASEEIQQEVLGTLQKILQELQNQGQHEQPRD